MKTANIQLFGNIPVYIKYCTVCFKIDYTLRCVEYICSLSPPLRRHRYSLHSQPLNREDTDTCALTIPYCLTLHCIVYRRLQSVQDVEDETKTDIEEQNNELRTQISKLSSKVSKYS